jgi:hypothetical protein
VQDRTLTPLVFPIAPRPPVNLLVTGDHEKGKPLADAEGLPASVARLQQLLATAQRYVEDVVVSHPGRLSWSFELVVWRLRGLHCAWDTVHIVSLTSNPSPPPLSPLTSPPPPSPPPPQNKTQAGRAKADPAIGRHLADTLALIPRLEPSEFERMFNEGIQDQLLVDYFANLVRTQVALAERLGTAALPLV